MSEAKMSRHEENFRSSVAASLDDRTAVIQRTSDSILTGRTVGEYRFGRDILGRLVAATRREV